MQGVGNAITLSVAASIVLTVFCFIFLPYLVCFFGATDTIFPYAMEYSTFIVLSLPFMMLSSSSNSIIRADGSPKVAMLSMIAGAVTNVILDPVFIFIFHMGVEGAAIATAIFTHPLCILLRSMLLFSSTGFLSRFSSCPI